MKKILIIGCLLLSNCTSIKSPSDVAKDVCKAAMIADPFVQQLIPSWGQTVEAVANAICILPDFISLFETMPPENAKQQTLAGVRKMASAYKSDGR